MMRAAGRGKEKDISMMHACDKCSLEIQVFESFYELRKVCGGIGV